MEYIEEVLAKCKKDDKSNVVGTILAGVFFFVTFLIVIIFFNGSKLLGLMLFLVAFLMSTIGFLLGTILGKIFFNIKKVKFNKTKMYKKLEKRGYLNEFIDTINKEINNESTIKYYDESGHGLLITETWFVFIDSLYPKFIKTSEIVKISDELDVNRSRFFMCLELKNNKYIRIDHLSCNEIEKEIKIKYPNIEIGREIIEE